MKYGETYICKRYRLYTHLIQMGFSPIRTLPSPVNNNYNWWFFENTPELEHVLDEYFNDIEIQKSKNV